MSKRIIQKYDDFNVEVNKDDFATCIKKMLENKNFMDRQNDLTVRGVRVVKHSCGVMDITIKLSSDKADLNYVIQHSGMREDLGYSDEFEPKPKETDPLVEAIKSLADKQEK